MGVNNCKQQGCLIGAQPVFVVPYPFFILIFFADVMQ